MQRETLKTGYQQTEQPAKVKEEASLAACSSLTKTDKTPCKQRVLLITIINKPTSQVNDQPEPDKKTCYVCHSPLEIPGRALQIIYSRDYRGKKIGPLCFYCFDKLIKKGIIPAWGASLVEDK